MRATARRQDGGLRHLLDIRGHQITADEPEDEGGSDAGAKPEELVAAGLAACTAMTLETYAGRKGWDVGDLRVDVDVEPGRGGSATRFSVRVHVPRELADEQRSRLLEIAAKCPVHRILEGQARFEESVTTG